MRAPRGWDRCAQRSRAQGQPVRSRPQACWSGGRGVQRLRTRADDELGCPRTLLDLGSYVVSKGERRCRAKAHPSGKVAAGDVTACGLALLRVAKRRSDARLRTHPKLPCDGTAPRTAPPSLAGRSRPEEVAERCGAMSAPKPIRSRKRLRCEGSAQRRCVSHVCARRHATSPLVRSASNALTTPGPPSSRQPATEVKNSEPSEGSSERGQGRIV
jgi:hypothetical protein